MLASGSLWWWVYKDSCFLIYIHLHFLNLPLGGFQTLFFIIREETHE